MGKFWLVCVHEYLRHVLRKRFIFALLSLPLVVVAIAVIAGISILSEVDSKPAGVVDPSGWLKETSSMEQEQGEDIFSRATLLMFADEGAARTALSAKEIQAFYVIGPDYPQTGIVRQVSSEEPGENVEEALKNLLRRNLLIGVEQPVAIRIIEGSDILVRSATDQREIDSTRWFNLVLPILTGVIFILVINMSGGYLLQAVVEEKENRTMEIVVTSVSAQQLMAGKIIGNLSVGLTQMLVWALFPILAFVLLKDRIPFLQAVQFDPQFLWLSLVTLLLAFVMISALMAMVGATATEAREAQQVAGIFTLPLVIPYWFTSQIMMNPDGVFSTILSIVPFTSPLSLPLRAAFAHIPEWQVALSLVLLFVSALLAMWLAGRAFRMGLLRYGKRLKLKELFGSKR